MRERIWALISDGLVANTIVADDSFINAIAPGYDSALEITDSNPMPGVGWTITNGELRPPKPGPNAVWDEGTKEWITQG